MDKRSFYIFSIVLALILAWSYFFPNAAPPPAAPPPARPAEAAGARPAESAEAEPAGPKDPPTGQATVETPKYTAVIDECGGRLVSFKLNGYKVRKLNRELPDDRMELVASPNPADRPLRLTLDAPGAPALAEAPFMADRRNLTLKAGETARLTMTFKSEDGLTAAKIFTFSGDSFLVTQEVVLRNETGLALEGRLINRLNSAPFQGDRGGRHDSLGAFINRRLVTESPKDAGEALDKKRGQPIDWVGFMDQYFLTALVPADPADYAEADAASFRAILQDHGGLAIAESRRLNLPPGRTSAFSFDFYYGPKAEADLKAAGHHLDRSVDMGWFSFIAAPLAALLKLVYSWAGNYGLAIIIVTVLIKIILWPLTAKSYRSMKEMQKLQPRIAKIREKYADDREALNRETMRLYKTFKVNPVGGCLPMLLQIPFFIAFYRTLDSLLDLRGAPFALWIQDLAAPERLGSLNFVIPFFEPPTGLPAMTLIMGLSMFIQQKMTPAAAMGDPTQAKVMLFMPLIFTFFLVNMPSGLVLYWLVNNLLSIAQQTLINRPEKRKPEAGPGV